MDAIIANLIMALINGGPAAILALLVMVLIALTWDRTRIMRNLERTQIQVTRVMEAKDAKSDEVVKNYFRATLATADALNSLKLVLIEINVRLTK